MAMIRRELKKSTVAEQPRADSNKLSADRGDVQAGTVRGQPSWKRKGHPSWNSKGTPRLVKDIQAGQAVIRAGTSADIKSDPTQSEDQHRRN
ncbi:apoptotic chromatin condensation inducer in the nucleus-like [Dorcoceras hygrometricum]|uniref:Apoptotic chromatin condensation inducer in the nucleus-like n=1 Tax=Dorcoceras hygrometricum TaxID=472368 RepID=A0A2Z7C5S9_9LAMI|nr:apoptotic chromatin condensation inducer in the nucleus-like [Dorcoceras hygrometricum]